MASTFVKDIMKKVVISADYSLTVQHAVSMMNDANVGCVIITKDGTSVGIFTERDLVKQITSGENSLKLSLSDVMSSPLITIDSEETVWEAAEIMKKNEIHKLPVQDNDKLIGIVTTTDLVRLCSLGSDSEMRKICDQILLRMQDNQIS